MRKAKRARKKKEGKKKEKRGKEEVKKINLLLPAIKSHRMPHETR